MSDLTTEEARVLGALGHSREDFGCYGFDDLALATGVDRKAVRRACRSLRERGLVEFHQTLWSEDGEMMGAGYGATKAGRDLANHDHSIPYIEV